MIPAGNKAQRHSSVNHFTKTIHHHHHYDHGNPFKELNEELSRLRKVDSTEYEMSADKFLGLNNNVCTTGNNVYATDNNVCTTEEHPIIDEEIFFITCVKWR